MTKIFQPGINLKEHLKDPVKRKLVGEAITNFLRAGFYDKDGHPLNVKGKRLSSEMIINFPPDVLRRALAAELISAGDVAATAAAVGVQRAAVFFPDVPADTQYLNIFRTVPSQKAGETYEQAYAGITFTELKLGEKPKLGTISQTANYVKNLKWGAAFGMFREWIEDNEIWKIEEVINEAKIAAFNAKAEYFYGLIRNASWTKHDAYATSWIASINKGLATLKRAKDGNDSPVLPSNVTPVLLCAPEKTTEILQAIRDTQVTGQRGERLTQIPDIIESSYILEADKKVFILVPKRRFINQEREALRTEQEQDIMLDANAYAWYFRGNGVILDLAHGYYISWS
jgi:hypothetical protein